MELDILESAREEVPRLSFNSHQDALDFVRESLKDIEDRLVFKNRNFTERYVKGETYIADRVYIQRAHGVYPSGCRCLSIFRKESLMSLRTLTTQATSLPKMTIGTHQNAVAIQSITGPTLGRYCCSLTIEKQGPGLPLR